MYFNLTSKVVFERFFDIQKTSIKIILHHLSLWTFIWHPSLCNHCGWDHGFSTLLLSLPRRVALSENQSFHSWLNLVVSTARQNSFTGHNLVVTRCVTVVEHVKTTERLSRPLWLVDTINIWYYYHYHLNSQC